MNDLPRPAAFVGLETDDLVAQFTWLSAVFAAPPDGEAIASYRRGLAARWLERVASLPGCAEAVERMRRALEADADDSRVAARVGSAYGILFEGIGGSTADACSARRPLRWTRFSPPTICRWPLPRTRRPIT